MNETLVKTLDVARDRLYKRLPDGPNVGSVENPTSAFSGGGGASAMPYHGDNLENATPIFIDQGRAMARLTPTRNTMNAGVGPT